MHPTRYEVHIAGTPRREQSGGAGDASRLRGDGAGTHQGVPRSRVNVPPDPPRPAVRRFSPVLQFLTQTDTLVEQQLQTLVEQEHRKGMTVQQICEDLYYQARALGYEAAMGVQEVYSTDMPSFTGQTVISALVLVDLKRIVAPEGYHKGRVAV